ncbi:MAG: glycosyltransferase family 4 protein [Thermoplasmatales archaeon]
MKTFDFAFVLGSFPFSRPTGGDHIVFELCKDLRRRGYTVALIIMKRPHTWLRRFLGLDPEEYYHFPRPYVIMERKILYKYLLFIVRFLKKVNYDYSFLHSVKFYFLNKPSRKFLVKNLIATWWGTAFFVADGNFNATKRFYFIQNEEDDPSFSGKLHTHAGKSYELPLEKIVINEYLIHRFKLDSNSKIKIGIDLNLFKITNPINNRDRKKILFTLRKASYKGAIYAIETISLLHEKYPDLILMGFGDVDPSSVPNYVTYFYKPSDVEVSALYNECSVFVSPSLVEGFSLMPLEAMACGASVISSLNNGVVEYIKSDYNGILVPPRDSKAIERAIIEIYSNDERREKLARNGNLTANNYTYENMVEDFIRAVCSRELS